MKRLRMMSVILAAMAVALILGASGCGGGNAQELTLAPESELPDTIKSQPAQVKIAYRFAMANPDVLEMYPCYCGCGSVGHMNNRDCYIKDFNPDGSVEFDTHALG